MALTRLTDDNINSESLVRTYANAAYSLANTANTLAQSAFDSANNSSGGGISTGKAIAISIIFG